MGAEFSNNTCGAYGIVYTLLFVARKIAEIFVGQS